MALASWYQSTKTFSGHKKARHTSTHNKCLRIPKTKRPLLTMAFSFVFLLSFFFFQLVNPDVRANQEYPTRNGGEFREKFQFTKDKIIEDLRHETMKCHLSNQRFTCLYASSESVDCLSDSVSPMVSSEPSSTILYCLLGIKINK